MFQELSRAISSGESKASRYRTSTGVRENWLRKNYLTGDSVGDFLIPLVHHGSMEHSAPYIFSPLPHLCRMVGERPSGPRGLSTGLFIVLSYGE